MASIRTARALAAVAALPLAVALFGGVARPTTARSRTTGRTRVLRRSAAVESAGTTPAIRRRRSSRPPVPGHRTRATGSGEPLGVHRDLPVQQECHGELHETLVSGVHRGPVGGPARGGVNNGLREGASASSRRSFVFPAQERSGVADLDSGHESDGQSEILIRTPASGRPAAVHLAPTERQQQLRAELRTYFRDVITGPDAASGTDATSGMRARHADDPAEQRPLLRRIGADGMLGLGWPVEYGGQGRGPDEQFVFFDEAYRAGAPVSMVTLNTVGPTLMKYGTEAQKDVLPAADPQRRPRLRDRLQRAGGRARTSAALRTQGGAGRRRLGDRRTEDLHQQRAERRLDLARLPYRPGRAQAQGHLDHPGPDRRPRASPGPRSRPWAA